MTLLEYGISLKILCLLFPSYLNLMHILRLFVNVIKQLVVGQLLEKIGSMDSTIQV